MSDTHEEDRVMDYDTYGPRIAMRERAVMMVIASRLRAIACGRAADSRVDSGKRV
ncbi:hypothetical protein B0G81_1112 [Paraburkholderia sp. BL6665CI2N2]|uniref:hypothetical protein n=1 Tax=Paraburkholderia sp. BL6665CI2N2 TaxID=1938806 RepID=UPI0010D8CE73|nr:hypothetical protein [Paraburkholderia sp. BL6665CI2N2]TDY20935.1 hypothetical protein B0G81_1112 [Paraburkholderia sp. BL6665CI2N2]